MSRAAAFWTHWRGTSVDARRPTSIYSYSVPVGDVAVVKRACLVVCVSVCLSVGEHISGKKHPLFIILCTLPVVMAQSSSGGVAICTSSFTDPRRHICA